MATTQKTFLSSLLAIVLISACAGGANRATQTLGNGVDCSVSAVASTAGASAQVTATCSGGKGPYRISNVQIGGRSVESTSSTFSFTTTFSVSVPSMSNLQGVSGSLSLQDSLGAVATYSFNILGGSISSDACTLTPSTASVAAGSTVTFSAAAASGWGTAPYTFSSFLPGTNGSATSALSATSSSTAQAIASYSAAGVSQASVSVADSSGRSGSCTASVTVNTSSFSCFLSQTVNANGTINIQALSNNGEPLTLVGLTPGQDGTIVSSGNPSTISYTSAGSKTVTARASSVSNPLNQCNGGATLTQTFTVSASGTSCSLSQSADSNGNSMVTATSTSGRALGFASFNPGLDGSVISNGGNPIYVRFNSPGMKSVSAQVYDLSSGQFCNGGVPITLSFYSNGSTGGGQLSCSLSQVADAQGRILVSASASNGVPVAFAEFFAGSDGSVLSTGNPTTVSYLFSGQKTVSARAYAPSLGVWCNGGSPITLTFNAGVAGGGSGGPLACNAQLSLNPVNRGMVSVAGFTSTGGIGAVSLLNIIAPTQAGVSVQYTGATRANVVFGLSGWIPLTYIVQDSRGAQASCVIQAQVY
jgi:trimeric autotransporter adhesin